MYGWLSDALRDDATVVTANRRMVRVLRQHYSQLQVGRGRHAWPSPEIHAWGDWLTMLLHDDADPASLPTTLNAQQSRLLWERSLLREVPATTNGLARLVRLCRDAWQRAADWQVSIRDVARAAQTDDQRLFASVAGRYLAILERERWVDEAALGALLLERISRGSVSLPKSITLAGFDRVPPVTDAVIAACRDAGVETAFAPAPSLSRNIQLHDFEDAEAELRAAGAWARSRLDEKPELRIAIVATNLERDTARKARLVREGCVPGWQYASRRYRHAVNVSLGRPLADYPAVAIALMLLRWLVRDLSSLEVCQLLRSRLIGDADIDGRHQLEMRLRRLPDRHWTPAMLAAELRRGNVAGTGEWLRLVTLLTRWRREVPARQPPADWALILDDMLTTAGWPGNAPLDSGAFQLVNRWREVLNDLARLGLVSGTMDLPGVLRRLELMAAETIFQPEAEDAVVQLLGPLEAAGSEFDAVWISGLSAANWPPPGNASPLLSLRLQRDLGMPDAEPADTVEFATTVLRRLGGAGREVICSFARRAEDAEQDPSSLIDEIGPCRPCSPLVDPGWHAVELVRLGDAKVVADDVPAVGDDERVRRGAQTIQQQLTEPLSAFIGGRLGVSLLQPQASGLNAALRGTILHDVLHRLYAELPSRDVIAGWQTGERNQRITAAVDGALYRHRRHADSVLDQLFDLERQRLVQLLRNFLAVEIDRQDYAIAAIEQEIDFVEAGIRLTLRADRIDRLADGTVAILDYKSGVKKRFLDGSGQPREMQLIAYACAIGEPVGALALVNIDSREIAFDGVGTGYARAEEWPLLLEQWKSIVREACADMSNGDVRINAHQAVLEARPLSLLSRYNELRRHGS